MADKKISIHLATSSNLAAINEVNRGLAKIAMSVGRANDAARQAALASTREWATLGGAMDGAASRAVLTAREIEEAWRRAMAAAKPPDDAARGFGRLADVAKGAARGIGGAFSGVFEMIMQGGVWGAATMAVTTAFKWAWGRIREAAEREAKRTERAWKDGLASIREGAEEIDKAFASSISAADKSISRFDAMTNSVKELTKAEIELAKQRAIANGMSREDASRAAADLSAQVDEEAEENRLRHLIETERKRVDEAEAAEAATVELKLEATKKKEAADAEYQRKRDEYVRKNAATMGYIMNGMGTGVTAYALSENEVAENRARAARDFEESDEGGALRGKVKEAADQLKSIATDEKALAAADDARNKIALAENALAALDAKRAARLDAARNDERDAAEKAAKERADAEARAYETARAAEVRAAQDAARERERLDRELHRKRMDDLRTEIAEQSKAAAPLRAAASAAQGAFDRAFAMYRDPSRAAAEIGEEKAYARDLDRLHEDARRYGGSWRIAELSRLMASGDTEGQTAALAEWRKSSRFTPEVEAMVRASAAERAKTTAEDELRKIEANTAGLAEKLESLLAMKEGA